MRLAYYCERSAAVHHLGVVDADGASVSALDDLFPPDAIGAGVLAAIDAGTDLGDVGRRPGPATPISDVRLRAPVPGPRRNIFCVGKNFRAHAAEFARVSGRPARGDGVPEHPIIFTKPGSAVIGDGDAIFAHPRLTAELDYEAELAVIIGRGGRGIPAGRALEHVWGYTVVNDITARDLQRRHRQWFLGKSLDTFCPMGPWAVTVDDVDLDRAEVTCRVNGELRQRASVRDLIFDVPTLVATISAGITLQAGDVIATGTPAGVGAACDPPRFLQPGDRVEAAVTGIGTLTNRVSATGPEM